MDDDELIIILDPENENRPEGHVKRCAAIAFDGSLRGLRAARTYIDGMIARKNGKPDEE